jgi:hypothetical protein
MSLYKVNLDSGNVASLEKYVFKGEGTYPVSPQELIVNKPKMVLDIPDLEIQSDANCLVMKEFNTNRGAIDVLMITANADIVIVETKLLRNPESHRTVVAQVIDYAKAFYDQNVNEVLEILSQKTAANKMLLEQFKKDSFWRGSLEKNIKTGNFQVVILGDRIHPNVLGMIESIQAAPHMAFSIYLVELDPYSLDGQSMVICPRVVSRTVEVERSVIRIQIDHDKKEHSIESEIPEKEGKGTRPILTPAQFIDSVTKAEFKNAIETYWEDWRKLGGDIKFGVAGFSSGISVGDKRVAPFFTYVNRVATLSETWRNNLGIPDDVYEEYKEDLKKSEVVYDGYIVGNKVEVPYSAISTDDLQVIFNAAMNLARRLTAEE